MIKRTLLREEIHILAPQSINIRLSLRGKDYVNIPIFHAGTSVFFMLSGNPSPATAGAWRTARIPKAYWLHIDHAIFILLALLFLPWRGVVIIFLAMPLGSFIFLSRTVTLLNCSRWRFFFAVCWMLVGFKIAIRIRGKG